jgi:hypothetical protein
MWGGYKQKNFLKFNDNMGDFRNVVLVLITPLLILIFFMWRKRKMILTPTFVGFFVYIIFYLST